MVDQAQSLRELVKKNASPEVEAEPTPEVAEKPPRDKVAKIITITSGKGGVGKSSITVNLAIALSRLGLHVLVIDADFGLANIDVMFGSPAPYNLSHLIKEECTLQELIQEGYGGVEFISGGSGIFDLLKLEEEQLAEIIEGLILEPYDIIIFDTGAGINDTVIHLMEASTESILVTTPEPTAILDAYALLKTISQTGNMPQTRLIMNKADSFKEAQASSTSFRRIAKKYLDVEVETLGSILYDTEVARSIKQQVPLIVTKPKSSPARAIQTIAETLLNLPPSPHSSSGPLAKLFGRWLGQA